MVSIPTYNLKSWFQADDCLVLPQNSSLEKLKSIHDQILARRGNAATNPTPGTSSCSTTTTTQSALGQAASSLSQPKMSPPASVKVVTSLPILLFVWPIVVNLKGFIFFHQSLPGPDKNPTETAVGSSESMSNACNSKSYKTPKVKYLNSSL